MLARQLGLGLGGHRADHPRTERLGTLTGDQTDAAGRRVNQHRVAGLHTVGAAQQQHRRSVPKVDAVRQFQQLPRRQAARLAVGTERSAGVGRPVAGHNISDPGADRFDDPGTLEAQTTRQGQRVEAAAVVGIDVVEADRLMP